MIQSPLTPRAASAEKYLQALAAEPYHLAFSRTEVVYSLPRRAATRSDVVASAAGRFNLKERVTVDWRVEDGYWRISRISVFRLVAHRGRLAPQRLEAGRLHRTSRTAGWKLSRFPRWRLLSARIPWKLSPGGQQDRLCGHFVKRPAEIAKRGGKLSLCSHSDGYGSAQGAGRKLLAGRTLRRYLVGSSMIREVLKPCGLGIISPGTRAGSSAVERQSYTLLVGGSIPSLPTILR